MVIKKKEVTRLLGRWVIPPCCGPNHPHENYIACEVKLSPKGTFFASCGLCMQNYFLKNWEPGFGYTVAGVEQMGMVVNISRARRLSLLRELGLEPQFVPPPTLPPMPTKGQLRGPPRRALPGPKDR